MMEFDYWAACPTNGEPILLTFAGECLQSPEDLRNRLAQLQDKLSQYRQLIGKLAVNRDKNHGWNVAREWCPFWKQLGIDLNTEAEQKAFLFGA